MAAAPMLHPLPMQNKKFHVVLLAGGPRDRAREIRDKLATVRDIFIKYHWEYDKETQWDRPIPQDVDFVIGLKDFMSHTQFDKLKKVTKKSGKRYILTQHKMSTMTAALHNYGIKKSEGIPVNLRSVAYFRDEEPELKLVPPVKKEEVKKAPPEPKLESTGIPDTAKVSIFVAQTPVPEGVPLEKRAGSPSAETMILIAALQRKAQDDNLTIMVTPESITIEPWK